MSGWRWVTSVRMRVRALLRTRQLDRELDDELRDHMEREAAVRVRAGADPAAARRDARLAFGGVEKYREEARDSRGVRLVEDVVQDLTYGLRALRRSPGFAVVVVLILGLGIGLASAIFGAVYAVLLKPLPYGNADDALVVWQSQASSGGVREELSPANFLDARDRLETFDAMAAGMEYGLDYMGDAGPETWHGWSVSESFFEILGIGASLGRAFDSADHVAGADPVVLLAHDFWQRRFGGDSAVVGSTMSLDGSMRRIIGVLPPAVEFPTKKDVYIPMELSESLRQQRRSTYMTVIGRLAPAATVAHAQQELSALAADLEREFPAGNTGVRFDAVPLPEQVTGDVRPLLVALMSAVGLLLLVAYANVANLFLARTTGRAREFAVRGALGAAGTRLARQLLVEAAILAVIGGLAGIALGYQVLLGIRALAPSDMPRLGELHFDPLIALFAAAIAGVAVLATAAVPAARAYRVRAVEGLVTARTTSTRRRVHLNSAFVVTQVALSFILVLAAGLIIRSFINVTTVDPGYRTDGVAAMSVFLYGRYNTPDEQRTLVAQVEDRLRSVPGVVAFGVSSSLPLHAPIGREDADIIPEGALTAPGEAPQVHGATVTPGFFDALAIPLISGRPITDADDASSYPVALISESLAAQHFAGVDPVGRTLSVGFSGGTVDRRIVGVVGDVRRAGLDEVPRPSVYVPFRQVPGGALVLTVRTDGPAASIIAPVSEALWEISPTLPLYQVATLADLRSASLHVRRFALMLLGVFGAAALTLASLGVYGVISQATAERRREFGVRRALGARTRGILTEVLGRAWVLTAAGVTLGCIGAVAGTALLGSLLYGVTAADAATWIAAAAMVAGAATLASLAPAWRAALVDPATVLKE